eukprot:RCo030368
MRRTLRYVGKSAVVVVGVAGVGLTVALAIVSYKDRTFPDRLGRAWTIYSTFLPIYADYKLAKWRVSEDKDVLQSEYDRLHLKHAPKVAAMALQLRGVWVKLAQAVASRPELAPEAYRDALSFLLDSVPPLEFRQLERSVCADLQVSSLEQIFEMVDHRCLGAASVSQVHAAKLKKPVIIVDGPNVTRQVSDVVLKIRYPDAPTNFDLDLLSVRQLVSLAAPQLAPAQKEVEKMIRRELNFLEEAEALKCIGSAVRSSGRFSRVVIPHPIPGMCSEGTIVMERMEGGRLETRLKEHYQVLAKGLGTTVEDLQQRVVSRFFGMPGGASGMSKKPPAHSGDRFPKTMYGLVSSAVDILGGPTAVVCLCVSYVKLLWYESFGWWLKPSVINALAATGVVSRVSLPERPLPVRTGRLYEDILQVHGFEMLELGWFNADPHPGNIFLTPDGKVALLDYGATSRLPDPQRLALANLILSLSEPNPKPDVIAKDMLALGFSFPADHDVAQAEKVLVSIATLLFTSRRSQPGQRGSPHGPGGPKLESIPDRFFLVARTAGLLRGLGFALGMGRVDVAKAWQGIARRAIQNGPLDTA